MKTPPNNKTYPSISVPVGVRTHSLGGLLSVIPDDVRRLANMTFDIRGRCVLDPHDFEHFAALTYAAGWREAELAQARVTQKQADAAERV